MILKKGGYLDDDVDYYKPERVRNAFKSNNGDYNYRVYESRGSQNYESLEEYFGKIKPPLRKNDKKLHIYWRMENAINN